MTQLEVIDGRLHIEVLGWHKLWAFKSRLDFPLEHVVRVERYDNEKPRLGFFGLRMPGTYVPGIIVAGTFVTWNRTYFYDVCEFSSVIEIEVRDESCKYLVIEVENVNAALLLMRRHLPRNKEADSLPVVPPSRDDPDNELSGPTELRPNLAGAAD